MITIDKKLVKTFYIIVFIFLVLSIRIFSWFSLFLIYVLVYYLVEKNNREFLFWCFLLPMFWLLIIFLFFHYLPFLPDWSVVIFLFIPVIFLIVIEDKYKNIIP